MTDEFGSFPRTDAIYKSGDLERSFDTLALYYLELLEGDQANIDQALDLMGHYDVFERFESLFEDDEFVESSWLNSSTHMEKAAMDEFPAEMHEKLGSYVYRLIDPRDGSTFYIGKGEGNRVFAHIKEALNFTATGEDEIAAKIKTIRQIKNAGLEPIHVIHRHGMTPAEALQVEAALIDATPGLTNIVSGHGSSQFGPAHATQILSLYQTEVLEFIEGHKIMATNISKTIEDRSLYDAVRFAWRVSFDRAKRADFVFAVTKGICREVYRPLRWMPATEENFPEFHEDIPDRYGFEGTVAEESVARHYKGKRLPESMRRKKGAASPILYNYK